MLSREKPTRMSYHVYYCTMVLYEDNHLLIVNKRNGDLVQGDQTKDKTILDTYKDYIKKRYNKPGAVFLHPVHRLDRPVSGCVILARTSKALTRMNELFRKDEVKKTYHLISYDRAREQEGTIIQYIIKDTTKNRSKLAKKGQANAKKAELSFSLAAAANAKFLYEVHPKTGRSHQIRVQMSSAGSPIIGDLKYGGKKGIDDRSIYLHCTSMTFVHPVRKEEMTVYTLPYKDQIWDEFKGFIKDYVSQFKK